VSENGKPETVGCTIDGVDIRVPTGTRILDAAARTGIDIPHYCYHPGLSAPAQCRMCLVEVEGVPKLAPACVATVADGNVIHTQSDTALKAREGVLEFYLVNHPLDCPVCDQSGECKLQDYVAAEGPPSGRSLEPKRVLGVADFGGDVKFYADRCVMCTRCVRFMREVARDERLAVVQRGHRNVIDTFFDHGVEGNVWADNIVDICPVGALVSKDFLHKARAWDLDRIPSVCPNCSQGCNVRLETRDNQIMRLKPRPNAEVNAYWMCDYGRLNYQWINRGDRIEAPLVRDDDGRLAPVAWSEALTRLADALRDRDDGATAVVSPFSPNEDLGAVRRLLNALDGGEGVFRSERGEEVELPGWPTLKLRADRAANGTGAGILGFTRVGGADAVGGLGGVEGAATHRGTLLVVGDELADADDTFGRDASLFVYVGHFLGGAARHAHFVLPATTFAEMDGSFVNVQRRVQRFWPALRAPGMARPAWQILGVLGQLSGDFAGLGFADLGALGVPLSEPAALPAE
jgi:NADH-quinone oxidoreductase subunit G